MSRRSKTAVSIDEVRRIASLSRLNLTRQEEEKLRGELSPILEYFKAVDGVRGAVAPAAKAVEPASLRTDEPRPSDSESLLKGVPRKKGRLVRAPRVF